MDQRLYYTKPVVEKRLYHTKDAPGAIRRPLVGPSDRRQQGPLESIGRSTLAALSPMKGIAGLFRAGFETVGAEVPESVIDMRDRAEEARVRLTREDEKQHPTGAIIGSAAGHIAPYLVPPLVPYAIAKSAFELYGGQRERDISVPKSLLWAGTAAATQVGAIKVGRVLGDATANIIARRFGENLPGNISNRLIQSAENVLLGVPVNVAYGVGEGIPLGQAATDPLEIGVDALLGFMFPQRPRIKLGDIPKIQNVPPSEATPRAVDDLRNAAETIKVKDPVAAAAVQKAADAKEHTRQQEEALGKTPIDTPMEPKRKKRGKKAKEPPIESIVPPVADEATIALGREATHVMVRDTFTEGGVDPVVADAIGGVSGYVYEGMARKLASRGKLLEPVRVFGLLDVRQGDTEDVAKLVFHEIYYKDGKDGPELRGPDELITSETSPLLSALITQKGKKPEGERYSVSEITEMLRGNLRGAMASNVSTVTQAMQAMRGVAADMSNKSVFIGLVKDPNIGVSADVDTVIHEWVHVIDSFLDVVGPDNKRAFYKNLGINYDIMQRGSKPGASKQDAIYTDAMAHRVVRYAEAFLATRRLPPTIKVAVPEDMQLSMNYLAGELERIYATKSLWRRLVTGESFGMNPIARKIIELGSNDVTGWNNYIKNEYIIQREMADMFGIPQPRAQAMSRAEAMSSRVGQSEAFKMTGTPEEVDARSSADLRFLPVTPREVVEAKTPKFKAWFGDWERNPAGASKVIDDEGMPLAVYHGSPRATEGNILKIGTMETTQARSAALGTFFTSDPKVAEYFVEGDKGNIGKFWLKLRHPFDPSKVTPEELPRLEQVFPSITAKMRVAQDPFDIIQRMMDIAVPNDPLLSTKGGQQVREKLQDLGYDGIALNTIEDTVQITDIVRQDGTTRQKILPTYQYIIFHPEQAKSVLANTGEYGPTTPSYLADFETNPFGPYRDAGKPVYKLKSGHTTRGHYPGFGDLFIDDPTVVEAATRGVEIPRTPAEAIRQQQGMHIQPDLTPYHLSANNMFDPTNIQPSPAFEAQFPGVIDYVRHLDQLEAKGTYKSPETKSDLILNHMVDLQTDVEAGIIGVIQDYKLGLPYESAESHRQTRQAAAEQVKKKLEALGYDGIAIKMYTETTRRAEPKPTLGRSIPVQEELQTKYLAARLPVGDTQLGSDFTPFERPERGPANRAITDYFDAYFEQRGKMHNVTDQPLYGEDRAGATLPTRAFIVFDPATQVRPVSTDIPDSPSYLASFKVNPFGPQPAEKKPWRRVAPGLGEGAATRMGISKDIQEEMRKAAPALQTKSKEEIWAKVLTADEYAISGRVLEEGILSTAMAQEASRIVDLTYKIHGEGPAILVASINKRHAAGEFGPPKSQEAIRQRDIEFETVNEAIAADQAALDTLLSHRSEVGRALSVAEPIIGLAKIQAALTNLSKIRPNKQEAWWDVNRSNVEELFDLAITGANPARFLDLSARMEVPRMREYFQSYYIGNLLSGGHTMWQNVFTNQWWAVHERMTKDISKYVGDWAKYATGKNPKRPIFWTGAIRQYMKDLGLSYADGWKVLTDTWKGNTDTLNRYELGVHYSPWARMASQNPLLKMLGRWHDFPLRVLRATDAFGAESASSMERRRLIMSDAIASVDVRAGKADIRKVYQDRLARHMAYIQKLPVKDWEPDIRLIEDKSREFGLRSVFIDKDSMAAGITNTITGLRDMADRREGIPAGVASVALHAAVPFVRIPMGLAKYGMDYSLPFSMFTKHSKFEGQAQYVARQVEAFTLAALLTWAYSQGNLTGAPPDDRKQRDLLESKGVKWWSFAVPDPFNPGGKYWISYQASPFGFAFANAATGNQLIRKGIDAALKRSPDKQTIAGVDMENLHQSWLQTAYNLFDFVGDQTWMQSLDILGLGAGYGTPTSKVEKGVKRRAEGFLPWVGMMRDMKQLAETVQQSGLIESVQQPLTGAVVGNLYKGLVSGERLQTQSGFPVSTQLSLSEPYIQSTPHKVNIWGENITLPGGVLQDWIMPRWKHQAEKPDYIEQAMLDRSVYPPYPDKKFKPYGSKEEVDIPDDVYQDYLIFMGKSIKDKMAVVIKNPGYKSMLPEKQKERLEHARDKGRAIADRMLRLEMLKRTENRLRGK